MRFAWAFPSLSLPFGHVFGCSNQPKDLPSWSLKVEVIFVPELDLLDSKRQDFLLKHFWISRRNLKPNRFPCVRVLQGCFIVYDSDKEARPKLDEVEESDFVVTLQPKTSR